MRDSVLKRYALAYIKKSGSNDNVKEFLRIRSEVWQGYKIIDIIY
ncbi:MAG: hypothetical protein ACR5LA_06340 [Wolbachia sp.]